MRRAIPVVLAAAFAAACASAPPPAPPPTITYENKLAWILKLEDQRILREPAPPPPAAVPARGRRPVVQPTPQPAPDLGRLVTDAEARVRRRAALAIGRVGLAEGVDLLVPLLKDAEPEVRQMAAFALGLIGNARAVEPLRAALADQSPLVRGRAAEALGLVGDQASAQAIAGMVYAIVQSGSLANIAADEMRYPLEPGADAFRLGVYALTRLKAFDALAGATLDRQGQPATTWWPLAFAYGRMPDKRAVPALARFVKAGGPSRLFGLRGMGALKDASAVPLILPLLQGWRNDVSSAIAAARALGEIGDASAGDPLVNLLQARELPPNLKLEVVAALGSVRPAPAVAPLIDLVGDPWPPLRAASLRALRDVDMQQFLLVLSGIEADPHWSVRSAIASLMGTLPAEVGWPRLSEMLKDEDQRVVPAVLDAIVKLRARQAPGILLEYLKRDDPLVRAAAANGIGELRLPEGPAALTDAFKRAQADKLYAARAAALTALSKYGASVAGPVLTEALKDPDWAVRVRAASLLKELDKTTEVASLVRPAAGRPGVDYAAPDLVAPRFSPHAYIATTKGTIELELLVLDAPLTSWNFMTLARSGFFNNIAIHRVVPNFVVQDGDPRGDGEGGPGYTLRDELNEHPYVRGTVGMALDWADTGGSQFFITHSPQPHLDARYTVFGKVVGGMDVVDRLQQWDVIKEVRIWDGRTYE